MEQIILVDQINIKGDKRMNELKNKILDLCNNSGLPLEAVIYVVKDVWRDAEMTLMQMQLDQKEDNKEEEK